MTDVGCCQERERKIEREREREREREEEGKRKSEAKRQRDKKSAETKNQRREQDKETKTRRGKEEKLIKKVAKISVSRYGKRQQEATSQKGSKGVKLPRSPKISVLPIRLSYTTIRFFPLHTKINSGSN